MDDVALFDLDGSLADYTGAMCRDLMAVQAPGEVHATRENLWDIKLAHIQARMKLIKSQPGWWRGLVPIATGFHVLKWCREAGFGIHVLTKGPKRHSLAWQEKVEWCQQYIGKNVDIHIGADKGLVYGKLLFDDHPEYMLRWLEHRPRGLGIMPTNAANMGFSHPNVIRYDGINQSEVVNAIRACKDRKHGEPLVLKRDAT